MGSPILIRRVWDRCNKCFAGVIRIRGGDPGLSGDTPRATARNTEQALLATQLNGVTQTWLRDMLYKNRILPGQASSARSLLCTVQDKCFAPGCWHYCKE